MVDQNIGSFNLIGIRINLLSHEQILAQMGEWIDEKNAGHMVVVANTHVLVESHQNPALERAVRAASLVIPDGMPLVVVARWRGFPLKTRSDGVGLMKKALSKKPFSEWRHYLYGGSPEVISGIRDQYPNALICRAYAPPFRPLTKNEDELVVKDINNANADVLWVGLGCPKQEIWINDHRSRLTVPVMLGVGQAFDVLAGTKPHAPNWMQNIGLEWLFRLMHEPKRLWKRYLVNNSLFLYYLFREQIGIILHEQKNHK
jgi:N-acetylglucosaminyldiphosphoundecaprenol N-acetyl-beta-D-mannosaminyltransferase